MGESGSRGATPSEVVAVDFSITSPGVAVWRDGKLSILVVSEKVRQDTAFELGGVSVLLKRDHNRSADSDSKVQRYLAKADELARLVSGMTSDPAPEGGRTWFVEGMAMQACGAVLDISEALGMFEHAMRWMRSDAYFTKVAPSTVKKSFCGRGNAKKDEMVEHALGNMLIGPVLRAIIDDSGGKLKLDQSPLTDIVDSYALLKMNLPSI